jgi:hypothetical protein
MPLHVVTPFHRAHEPQLDESLVLPPGPTWRRHAADTCFILIKAGGFLASTYLMTLGVPLLFSLMTSGGSVDVFFAQVANLADRFLSADAARQSGFVEELKFGLIGLATLMAIWRMPRFLNEVADGLREEEL